MATIFLILLVASEEYTMLTTHWYDFWLMDWSIKYWFILPFVSIVLIILINELWRRKLLNKLINSIPFTYAIDTLFLAVTVGFLLYWFSEMIGFTKGQYMNIQFNIIWGLFIVYSVGIVFRGIIFKKNIRNKNLLEQTDFYLDQPITQFHEDKLERNIFAIRVAKIIETSNDKDSLVLGLYGKWGSGKTSVMNLMKLHFSSNKDVLVIPFNPWYFENEVELIRQFFLTLSNGIAKNFDGEEGELISTLKRYAEIITQFNLGAIPFSFNGVLDIFKEKEGDILELRASIENQLLTQSHRIVILIDDLDRLDKKEIQSVFKLVKLIADFPYTSFIMAFDDEIVSDALAEQYNNTGLYMGESFLEKIIQIPLPLPPAELKNIRQFSIDSISKILNNNNIVLSNSEVHRFISIWDRVFGKFNFTLRLVKRYLNSVTFSLPLLKNEVNIVDLLCIEALRVFFPKIYKFIYQHSQDILTAGRMSLGNGTILSEKYKVLFDQLFSNMTTEDIEIVETLIEELFPRSKFLFTGNTHYGQDWDKEWNKEKRICSVNYFRRYFLYTVPSDEISDVAFKQIISLSEQEDVDVDIIFGEIMESIKVTGIDSIIKKLRNIESELSESAARNLVIVISRMGTIFSKIDGLQGVFSSWTQSAILIHNLVKLLPKEQQLSSINTIIITTEPLLFGVEVFSWVRPNEEKPDNLFNESEISTLAKQLIGRIKLEATNDDFLGRFGTDTNKLLWIWQKWGDKKEIYQVISRWLGEQMGAERFLSTFAGKYYDMETGVPARIEFEFENYDSVKLLFPPEEIAEILSQKYEMPSSKEDYYRAEKKSELEQVAIQFLWLHQKRVSNENVEE